MKKFVTFLSLLAIVFSAFAFGSANFASATNSTPTPTPSCGTLTFDRTDSQGDLDNNMVKIDFTDFQNPQGSSNDGYYKITIQGKNGWTVTEWNLEVASNNTNGWDVTGSGDLTDYNPQGNQIEEVSVEVYKSCPTASPTATPQSVNVNVCHQDGQSGNYSHITVSVHSVNDANGLNGHGGHSGDIWAPFTYNNVNYPGQGNYNGYNMSNCNPNATATPTATASATATSTATAYPTINPCDGECPTTTPTATPSETVVPTPTATATPLVCSGTQHLNANGTACVDFELGGPSSNGGSAQGQVLGASTMAGTGNFAETLYQAIMGLGAIFTAKGLKKGKKASK